MSFFLLARRGACHADQRSSATFFGWIAITCNEPHFTELPVSLIGGIVRGCF
jgi:hypothetical protein